MCQEVISNFLMPLLNGRDYSESFKEFERAGRLDDSLIVVGFLGNVYATSGRRAEARRVLKRLQEHARTGTFPLTVWR